VSFFNLYRHNFVRVAVAVPEVRVADPAFNAAQSIELLRDAAARDVALVVFPELGLSAYSCDDLFQQQALQDGVLRAIADIRSASKHLDPVAIVGAPLVVDGQLYNCALVVHRGRVLGVVPKTYLPNYREFYEQRQFVSGRTALRSAIAIGDQSEIPFGAELLFRASEQPLFAFHIEICEDVWTPAPPSSFAALAGATVLTNLSASNATIGKFEYRRLLAESQSARCLAAYVFSAAGYGESTTDLAWDGHGLVYENGTRLAETVRYARSSQLALADIDLDRIAADRLRQGSFAQSIAEHRERVAAFRSIEVPLELPTRERLPLARRIARYPYVPSDPATRAERCREVHEIQTQGLIKRLDAMRARRVVIGVSGGLDSAQALLVAVRAMDELRLPRSHIIAVTMPGYATSTRTLDQARRLMQALGVSALEIDIRPSCEQMLKDIGHPHARGESVHDLTFENVQAGERTSHLFRLANRHAAPVIGTGDLSELALGWCTYGVGDQMSHYNVNASVPKTLIRFLVQQVAENDEFGAEASAALRDVLATPITPELVPGNGDQPAQESEAVIGPYALQDFNLYYTLRFGYSPAKVAFLAWSAWHDADSGDWPAVPAREQRAFTMAEIKRWLTVFLTRFIAQSQFKRSAMPNGPKVGSGGALSPRGDWRAPSDADPGAWLAALDQVPEREP
jgi:NAD+ synthase (glutamine-hydrolysing)